MPRILLVKTSSLGDVIHNLPVVSDIRANVPDARIDWVCEAPYANLVQLHSGVQYAFPVNLRYLKKNLFSAGAWREFLANKRAIGSGRYEFIIDTQGLVKSAWIATFAQGSRYGFARDSAREPLASRFYHHTFHVPGNQHAVERNRELAARSLGYAVPPTMDYGLRAGNTRLDWLQRAQISRYAVFLHATSRAEKCWPEIHWGALGNALTAQGLRIVLPWGTIAEKGASDRIAALVPQSVVAPPIHLVEAAQMLANAALVVGVDTGLAHLAVAAGAPTIGIYTATDPGHTGLFGGRRIVNLGGEGVMPEVDTVLSAAQEIAST